MPTFNLNSQRQIDEGNQGVNLSEFTYLNDERFSEENLIDSFIHSTSFTEESRKEQIKNYKGDLPFLRQAFEIDLVAIDDFKQINKISLIQFLNDYAKQDDWGDTDGNDFIKLKDKFVELLKTVQSDKFYLISKEWFHEKDKKLREPENWIYTYYFLTIWVDKINETLIVSEWTYD